MKRETIRMILIVLRLTNLALCLMLTSFATQDWISGNIRAAVWFGTVALFPLFSTVVALVVLPEDK